MVACVDVLLPLGTAGVVAVPTFGGFDGAHNLHLLHRYLFLDVAALDRWQC